MLLADAHGDVAAVDCQGAQRRVSRPADGLALGTGPAGRDAELAKLLGASRDPGPREIADALASADPMLAVDPEARSVAVVDADGESWISLGS